MLLYLRCDSLMDINCILTKRNRTLICLCHQDNRKPAPTHLPAREHPRFESKPEVLCFFDITSSPDLPLCQLTRSAEEPRSATAGHIGAVLNMLDISPKYVLHSTWSASLIDIAFPQLPLFLRTQLVKENDRIDVAAYRSIAKVMRPALNYTRPLSPYG